MIVLGISETHCATAAILRDGAVVACASEERFTRLKNDAGYPRLAVDACLREAGLRPAQIDRVALAGRRAYAREWMNRVLHDGDYAREYYGVRLDDTYTANDVEGSVALGLSFLVFLYNFSAGLTLYWTVQNLLTIAQTKLTRNIAEPPGPAKVQVLTPPQKKKK